MNYQLIMEEFDKLSIEDQDELTKEIHRRGIARKRLQIKEENEINLRLISEGKYQKGTGNDFFVALENESDLD